MKKSISIDTVVILTNISKRTIWRRLNDRKIIRTGTDTRGRTMLDLNDIISMLPFSISEDDYELLTGVDNSDPNAQNDLAQLFMECNKFESAHYWFRQAADQQHADAMQNLSTLYHKGLGIEKNKSEALTWLLKAATQGHIIAKEQLKAFLNPNTPL